MINITKPSENRVNLVLEGAFTADNMADGLDELISMSENVQNGVLWYEIRRFDWPSASILMVELKRIPKLFGLLGKFDKCAVVSDIGWIRKFAEIEGKFMPGLTIKSFEMAQGDAAEAWLAAT